MTSGKPTHATFQRLSVEIHESAQQMGTAAAERAAEIVRHATEKRGRARIVLATGTSQLPFFEALRHQQQVDWNRVTVFHMDEYVGLPATHPASFRAFLRTHVVQPLGIGTFHGIDGEPEQVGETMQAYRRLLEEDEIDLCCMGIGENGHLAFNDPPVADFDDPQPIKVVELDEVSRLQQVREGHFAAIEEVPTHAITLTIPTLLSAHNVQVVVPEGRKAEAVAAALTGPIDVSCPASILRRASNAVLFLDRAAAGRLDLQ